MSSKTFGKVGLVVAAAILLLVFVVVGSAGSRSKSGMYVKRISPMAFETDSSIFNTRGCALTPINNRGYFSDLQLPNNAEIRQVSVFTWNWYGDPGLAYPAFTLNWSDGAGNKEPITYMALTSPVEGYVSATASVDFKVDTSRDFLTMVWSPAHDQEYLCGVEIQYDLPTAYLPAIRSAD